MPYAYVEKINHIYTDTHLEVYVTFRHQMQRSEIPQASPPVYDWYPIPARWLLEADEVPVDILSSEWIDEFTLKLTSDTVASEPTGVTLEYAGPDEKLCYNWGKQIEPFGARESFTGYPTTPAPHNSTHENGGSDEINIAGLSGLLADTQHSFVDRGDPAAFDFTVVNFTCDNEWHELDLSAIVPAEATAVILKLQLKTAAVAKYIYFRKNGNVNPYNSSFLATQVTNLWVGNDLIIALDTNKKVSYIATAYAWTAINVTVAGWFL
ncbi:MAG: hypothetical protein MUP16_05450 [Sedimentisphaerales bacterium]|nr:hypothetical protein [Sedimentisphaerales bacterium]